MPLCCLLLGTPQSCDISSSSVRTSCYICLKSASRCSAAPVACNVPAAAIAPPMNRPPILHVAFAGVPARSGGLSSKWPRIPPGIKTFRGGVVSANAPTASLLVCWGIWYWYCPVVPAEPFQSPGSRVALPGSIAAWQELHRARSGTGQWECQVDPWWHF